MLDGPDAFVTVAYPDGSTNPATARVQVGNNDTNIVTTVEWLRAYCADLVAA